MSNPFVTDPSLGLLSALNITTNTILTTSGVNMPGMVATVSIPVGGSAAGTINDVNTIAGALPANAIMALPTTGGIMPARMATTNGIVIIPGTGQTVCVWFSK